MVKETYYNYTKIKLDKVKLSLAIISRFKTRILNICAE